MSFEPSSLERARKRAAARAIMEKRNCIRACHGSASWKTNRSFRPPQARAPGQRRHHTVRGGAVGDRIVLHGEGQDGSLRRWSFNDIGPDSFDWRGERSSDHGANWRLTT
jgi:hypothetical protein